MQAALTNNDAVCRVVCIPKNQGKTRSECRSEVVAIQAISLARSSRIAFSWALLRLCCALTFSI